MIAQIITLVATLATGLVIVQARAAIRHTTLTTAWSWSLIALAAWVLASLASLALPPNASTIGQLWYTAAVLTLCPWIAVLGARRPVVRVWNWFVLLPLATVLLWPVALCWMPRGPDRLILETPALVGFGLVLLMGTGNYLGTRFTALAVFAAIVEIGLITSIRIADSSGRTGDILRAAAACLLFSTVLSATRSRQWHDDKSSAWDSLWRDFRNTFGIVWANRIAERVNAEAAKGDWSVRLQPFGFVSTTPGQTADLTVDAAKIEHTMRWLLRRFVDDQWIDERVTQQKSPPAATGGTSHIDAPSITAPT